MLSRNLFYTGLTRAKKLALIVVSEKAIKRDRSPLKSLAAVTTLISWSTSNLLVKADGETG